MMNIQKVSFHLHYPYNSCLREELEKSLSAAVYKPSYDIEINEYRFREYKLFPKGQEQQKKNLRKRK